jgi:hypothetical protein
MKRVLLSAACLALAALCAHAAGDKLKLGSFGPGKASGPLLTKVELRDCLERMDRIRTRNDALSQERERIERDKAELIRQGDELKAALETLDRSNAEAVEAFKARAAARDQALDGFDKRTGTFNGEVENLSGERKQFAQRCENRRFDQDDETAIRAGK